MRVFAIVVTFNRPEMLRNCLSALFKQQSTGLERIHIIINSDDDETVKVIKSFQQGRNSLTFVKYDNLGPAGGYNYGLKKFIEEGYDFAWLMDDDVVVYENCLQELLECAAGQKYVFPKVIKGDGKEIISFGWWGVLIRKDLVVEAGYPITELFFWAEDTEYLQNRLMRKVGVQPVRCTQAVVKHYHQRSNKKPSWYYYYSIRNTLYYRKYIAGYTWYRIKRTMFLFPYSLFQILFREDNKLRKLLLLAYGTYHGLIGKIGKIIDPSLNK